LPVKARKKLVKADIFGHQIKRYPDNLGRQYAEYVGYNDK